MKNSWKAWTALRWRLHHVAGKKRTKLTRAIVAHSWCRGGAAVDVAGKGCTPEIESRKAGSGLGRSKIRLPFVWGSEIQHVKAVCVTVHAKTAADSIGFRNTNSAFSVQRVQALLSRQHYESRLIKLLGHRLQIKFFNIEKPS